MQKSSIDLNQDFKYDNLIQESLTLHDFSGAINKFTSRHFSTSGAHSIYNLKGKLEGYQRVTQNSMKSDQSIFTKQMNEYTYILRISSSK